MFGSRQNVASNSYAVPANATKGRGMKASIAVSFCALALVLAAHSSASAVDATAEQRSACTPDVFRLCSSDIPNVKRIIACLEREKPKLSSACRAVFNPPARTATRSASDANLNWCTFSRGEQPKSQEVWQTWCRHQ